MSHKHIQTHTVTNTSSIHARSRGRQLKHESVKQIRVLLMSSPCYTVHLTYADKTYTHTTMHTRRTEHIHAIIYTHRTKHTHNNTYLENRTHTHIHTQNRTYLNCIQKTQRNTPKSSCLCARYHWLTYASNPFDVWQKRRSFVSIICTVFFNNMYCFLK